MIPRSSRGHWTGRPAGHRPLERVRRRGVRASEPSGDRGYQPVRTVNGRDARMHQHESARAVGPFRLAG